MNLLFSLKKVHLSESVPWLHLRSKSLFLRIHRYSRGIYHNTRAVFPRRHRRQSDHLYPLSSHKSFRQILLLVLSFETSPFIFSHDIHFLIDNLSSIKYTYGKYAVIGDHDYLKEETLKNIYIQSGFTLLDNSYSIIKNSQNKELFIGGINSYTYDSADINKVIEDYIKDIQLKYQESAN